MSPWQLKRQLPWWIVQQKWLEAPQGFVISGGGLVTEDEPGNFRAGDREVDGPLSVGLLADGGVKPFAIVSAELISWDGESLARIEQVLVTARLVAGGGPGTPTSTVGSDPGAKGNTTAAGYDTHGLNQVTGALRATPNGQGQSQGRDVDELLARVAELVGETGFVDSVHGFQGRLVQAGPMDKVFGSQVLERGVAVEVLNSTASNYYHPGFRLRGSGLPEVHKFLWFADQATKFVFFTDIFRVQANAVTVDFIFGSSDPLVGIPATTSNSLNSEALRDRINAHPALAGLVAATAGFEAAPDTRFTKVTRTGAATLTLTYICIQPLSQQGVSVTSTGGVSLTWTLPPARFDTLKGILKRGTNAGDPAPTSPTAGGTVIPLASALATSASDAVGPGTWNYSYFMSYAETPAGQLAAIADRYSAPITATVVVP